MSDKTGQQMETERWQGEMGEKWLAFRDQFEGMISPVGEALIAKANFQPGEQVVDVGCGAGVTSLEIAALVGDAGSVTGLDISPMLVEAARERAEEAGFDNAGFILGDAAVKDVPGKFDCLFSRFGTMFFEEPYGAFQHMHGFLKPGGRLVIGTWAPPPENEWVLKIMEIVGRHVELPESEPRAPGPFALSEPDYIGDILGQAGFTDIQIDAWTGNQLVGGPGADAATATQFLMDAVFVGDALADEPEDVKAAALADIKALLRQYETPDGVKMGGKAWFTTARA